MDVPGLFIPMGFDLPSEDNKCEKARGKDGPVEEYCAKPRVPVVSESEQVGVVFNQSDDDRENTSSDFDAYECGAGGGNASEDSSQVLSGWHVSQYGWDQVRGQGY
jgi:hypothetical protein